MPKAEDIQLWLINWLAETLGVDPKCYSGETALEDLGVDSITRVALVLEIEKQFRRPLDPDSLDQYSTLSGLSSHLAAQGEID